MLIDSHCHLNFIDLTPFNHDLAAVIQAAKENDVMQLLSVCVDLDDYPVLCQIAERFDNVSISVGVHPDQELQTEPDVAHLCQLASHPDCIAIGETGLDFYRVHSTEGQENQRQRFRTHIQASIASGKPLIIHTRQAASETIAVMKEEGASQIGGVMHCFTEEWSVAKAALDLNFYISMSGIVTFKNAATVQEVARKIPSDRLLIETDAPYLAPTPFRGKQNHPALVKHVAEYLSALRGVSFETLARETTDNFNRCFKR